MRCDFMRYLRYTERRTNSLEAARDADKRSVAERNSRAQQDHERDRYDDTTCDHRERPPKPEWVAWNGVSADTPTCHENRPHRAPGAGKRDGEQGCARVWTKKRGHARNHTCCEPCGPNKPESTSPTIHSIAISDDAGERWHGLFPDQARDKQSSDDQARTKGIPIGESIDDRHPVSELQQRRKYEMHSRQPRIDCEQEPTSDGDHGGASDPTLREPPSDQREYPASHRTAHAEGDISRIGQAGPVALEPCAQK